MSPLTLTTDFGERDGYGGILKGVIAQINPQIPVIDLTHTIPPQNIAAGRFCLMNAYPYFPTGTVHLAVVDPGVGSHRRAIAVQLAEGYFVGPDNGLISGILSLSPAIHAVVLTNKNYWRVPQPSTTFHGRDIFAPVAAHLASGVPLANFGDSISIESLVSLPLPRLTQTPEAIAGCIQYIDVFGNLITNIPQQALLEKSQKIQFIHLGNHQIPWGQTYSDAPFGEAIALIGSHGWLEIAVNGGNAQQQLAVALGDSVQINPLF
ncbi:MAG: SAM-dependent chlorinase/fluorinase [Snowella sp.]|nr:SAM-dependent chlorinase/fluorinase [Snowella sp.]